MHTLIETIREFWLGIHAGSWPELGFWSYALLVLLVATEATHFTAMPCLLAKVDPADTLFAVNTAVNAISLYKY